MSTLKADTIQSTGGGAATLTKQAAAKAYATIDGINHSNVNTLGANNLNIASLADEGTGKVDVNFTNNFDSTDYTYAGACQNTNGAGSGYYGIFMMGAYDDPSTTGDLPLFWRGNESITPASRDPAFGGVIIHGELA